MKNLWYNTILNRGNLNVCIRDPKLPEGGDRGRGNLQDETAALKVEEAGVCLFSSFLSFHKYLNFQTGQMQSTDHSSYHHVEEFQMYIRQY